MHPLSEVELEGPLDSQCYQTRACTVAHVRGGAPAGVCDRTRAILDKPHISLEVDQVLDQIVPLGPTQVSEGFIATLVF